jgi:hypothetical protein
MLKRQVFRLPFLQLLGLDIVFNLSQAVDIIIIPLALLAAAAQVVMEVVLLVAEMVMLLEVDIKVDMVAVAAADHIDNVV